jgi:hypothetical protein
LVGSKGAKKSKVINVQSLWDSLNELITDKEHVYSSDKRVGLELGARFQVLEMCKGNSKEVIGLLKPQGALYGALTEYILMPEVLDACLHVFVGLNDERMNKKRELEIPFYIRSLTVFDAMPAGEFYVYAKINVQNLVSDNDQKSVDYYLCNKDGYVFAEIKGFIPRKYIGNQNSKSLYFLPKYQNIALGNSEKDINSDFIIYSSLARISDYIFPAAKIITAFSELTSVIKETNQLLPHLTKTYPCISSFFASNAEVCWSKL